MRSTSKVIQLPTSRRNGFTGLYTLQAWNEDDLHCSSHSSDQANTHSITLPSPNPRLNHPLILPKLTHDNGRRRHKIPPPKPQILSPPSPPPQPRHLPLHSRIHPNHMAQSEGSAAAGRKANHTGQEKHECFPPESGTNILRTAPSSPNTKHSSTGLLRQPSPLVQQRPEALTSSLGTAHPPPHPLHHPPHPLPHPPRRLHPRPTHRAPKQKPRPSTLSNPRTRRRPAGHALRHDGEIHGAGAEKRGRV